MWTGVCVRARAWLVQVVVAAMIVVVVVVVCVHKCVCVFVSACA